MLGELIKGPAQPGVPWRDPGYPLSVHAPPLEEFKPFSSKVSPVWAAPCAMEEVLLSNPSCQISGRSNHSALAGDEQNEGAQR